VLCTVLCAVLLHSVRLDCSPIKLTATLCAFLFHSALCPRAADTVRFCAVAVPLLLLCSEGPSPRSIVRAHAMWGELRRMVYGVQLAGTGLKQSWNNPACGRHQSRQTMRLIVILLIIYIALLLWCGPPPRFYPSSHLRRQLPCLTVCCLSVHGACCAAVLCRLLPVQIVLWVCSKIHLFDQTTVESIRQSVSATSLLRALLWFLPLTVLFILRTFLGFEDLFFAVLRDVNPKLHDLLIARQPKSWKVALWKFIKRTAVVCGLSIALQLGTDRQATCAIPRSSLPPMRCTEPPSSPCVRHLSLCVFSPFPPFGWPLGACAVVLHDSAHAAVHQ
jgi:hypothetical protein